MTSAAFSNLDSKSPELDAAGTRRLSAAENNRVIGTGRGGRRRSFKGWGVRVRLKFRKQMILSERSGSILTREPEEGALRNDWTIETNWGRRRTAIPRKDHTRAQRKFENQQYEVIGAAKLAHRNFEK